MFGARKLFDEKFIHRVFEVSLLLKVAFAAGEIVAGVAAYFATPEFLYGLIGTITRAELAEDPRDLVANFLARWAQHLSVSAERFLALYLLSHGVVKLWVIIGLLRERLWYYPVALVVFTAFIVYQIHRYTITHSVWLLAITVVDLVVIWLTWHEYRYLRHLRTSPR